MTKRGVRTHIVLPREVVADVDRLVGQRRRSQYMAEAIREKLRRDKLIAALEAAAGALKDADIPDWATPERTSAWVRELRRQDNDSTERALRASENE